MKTHIDGIDRDMTAAEIADYEKLVANMQVEVDEYTKRAKEKEKTRKTAIAKLQALGLTENEIASLVG